MMQITIKIHGKNVSSDDIRHFIMMVRDWELRTPHGQIDGLRLEADPPLGKEQVIAIFKGVFKDFQQLAEIPEQEQCQLRLGRRLVKINGKPVGVLQEMVLLIDAGTEKTNQLIQEAEVIELARYKGHIEGIPDES